MLIFLWTLIALTSCSQLNKDCGICDDNPIEECLEDVLKKEFQLDIDLSPATPEPSQAYSTDLFLDEVHMIVLGEYGKDSPQTSW